jgi:hypothetical protein
MGLGVGPYIHPSDQVIEDGKLSIGWGGDTCYPVGCSDLYNVRIERLGMAE